MKIDSLLPDTKEVAAILVRDVEELPSIPVVVVKLLKLTQDERSSTVDLVRLVETEPAIMTKVLRIVNSAAFGRRKRITSVYHAIVLLGFSTIRALALEVSLYEQLVGPGSISPFDRIFFWQHCLAVASLSRTLARELDHPDPEEVYVAGLLHDIGKIILDVYGRITYRDFLKAQDNSHGLLLDKEAKFMGLAHDDIGSYFCHLWELHPSITLAVKFHHQRFADQDLPDRDNLLVAIVSLANFISWAQGVGSVNMLHHPILQPEVTEIIDLSRLDLQAIILAMDKEVKATAQFYDFTFPSIEQFREHLLRTNIELSRLNTQYYFLHDQLKKKIQSLIHIKKSLTTPYKSLDTEEIIANTLEAVHLDFGYERIYVLQVDEATRSLTSTAILDRSGSTNPLEAVTIQVTPFLEAFIDCLRSKTPTLVTGVTRDEQKVLFDLRVDEIGLVPITNNNQIIGLIGVDNIESAIPIELHDLSAVTIVANELGMALEHARIFHQFKIKASIDALTQMHNRASIEELLTKEFHRAREGEIVLSLGMVDIDHFKKFNDNFGHLAGDSVLKLLASTMKKFSRPNDAIGRFGGEEFLILLKETDFNAAFRYGERLRREVEKLGHLLSRRFTDHHLTVSIGIAAYEPVMAGVGDLINKADEALYMAKEEGRNKVVGMFGDRRKISKGGGGA